jgi:hypothetical protein
MNRRGFLGSILALAAAPAIVRADSLMRIVPVETTILPAAPILTGEAALIAALKAAWEAGGEPDLIRCSPTFARTIEAEFSGAATRFEASTRPVIPVVSVYVSDYAVSKIVVDRTMEDGFAVESLSGLAQALLH